MGTPITEANLEEMLLHGFQRSAFRLEAQSSYMVGIERDALHEFAEGHPQPPSNFTWWREWLDLVARHARHGQVIERVRVEAEPPPVYQQWLRWGDRWHIEAGERIFYLPRTGAVATGLPLDADWWLFDSAAVAVMRFAVGGVLAGISLLTDADAVHPYCQWRELAIRHATAAPGSAAA